MVNQLRWFQPNERTRRIIKSYEGQWVSHDDSGRQHSIDEQKNNKLLDDKEWEAKDFIDKYSDIIKSIYCGNIITCFLEPKRKDLEDIQVPREDPGFEVPRQFTVLAQDNKILPYENWATVIKWCIKNN